MEKGKLGIRLGFYGVLAFVLAYLGYSTLLFLLAGFVIVVEKDEWASRQVIQAVCLCLIGSLVNEFFNLFDFFYNVDIAIVYKMWSWLMNGVSTLLNIVILVFAVLGVIKNAKGKDANIPLLSQFADWAYGVVKSKAAA